MSEHRHASARPTATGPWVIDTRDLGRRAGSSRELGRTVPAAGLGLAGVIAVPAGAVTSTPSTTDSNRRSSSTTPPAGTAATAVEGECSRCLEPLSAEVEVELTELYAYPDSTTDETTEEDEVSRLQDDLIDLEPVVRDAIVLALPQVPLCSPDCLGLCVDCGGRLADLGPDHGHETIDPRWAALQERFDGNRDNPEEN